MAESYHSFFSLEDLTRCDVPQMMGVVEGTTQMTIFYIQEFTQNVWHIHLHLGLLVSVA